MNNIATLTPLSELESRVSNGARVLDEVLPGWRNRINVDRIEGACDKHGIAGQLFGPSIRDQMTAVGLITPGQIIGSDEEGTAIQARFAALGFAVLAMERAPIGPLMRALALEIGIPESEIPTTMRVPRDESVAAMEETTYAMLWAREVNKR